MSRFLLPLLLLCFFVGGCIPDPYGAIFVPYYTQNLRPIEWSDDGETLYLLYGNRSGESLDPTLFYLKVDVNLRESTFLYNEKNGPGVFYLGKDDQSRQLIFYSADERSPELIVLSSEKSANNPDRVALQDDDFHAVPRMFLMDGYILGPLASMPLSDGFFQWGRYRLSDHSNAVFEMDLEKVKPLTYLSTLGDRAYLSSYYPGQVASKELNEQHAVGKIELEQAVISNLENLPPYDGHLRFWGWLSDDEILFSQVRENGTHLQSVSYQLSAQTYRVRDDFRQRGLLSPDKSKVAFVEGDFLIISNADGSQSRKILYIPQDLPKGDPEILG